MPDQSMIKDAVRREVGWAYDSMKWLDGDDARHTNDLLSKKFARIASSANLGFKGNKLYTGALSKGCKLCGCGSWSCIFMTDACAANCFFCPQIKPLHPSPDIRPIGTEGIVFANPKDYSGFLKAFKYGGTSFSGGDPLTNIDKLAEFIETIREQIGSHVYLWAYTNCRSVNKSNLSKLKGAGLDELRINITTSNYSTEPVALAKKYINTVTVEIPAIPEDFATLSRTIALLDSIGIDHLNLHKLNANRVNYRNYIERNYTFVHHGGISILESEIAALDLMERAMDENIRLPINYCSASYKGRVQLAGSRRRIAAVIMRPYESVTEAGYIRSLYILKKDCDLGAILLELKSDRSMEGKYYFDEGNEVLYFKANLLSHPNAKLRRFAINVEYSKAALVNMEEIDEDCERIEINEGFSVGISREPLDVWEVPVEQVDAFSRLLRDNVCLPESIEDDTTTNSVDNDLSECITPYEEIIGGFTEIF